MAAEVLAEHHQLALSVGWSQWYEVTVEIREERSDWMLGRCQMEFQMEFV